VDAWVCWLDDPRYPRHKDEQMKLLEMITVIREGRARTVALNEAPTIATSDKFRLIRRTSSSISTNGVLI
jgi:hypothetical protein